MSYLFILFGIGLLFWLYFQRSRKQRLCSRQRQLENSWAKPKNDYFNFDRIARYAELKTILPANRLSPQTLIDIDFQEVFKFIDRTNSKPGQQFLYDHLLNPQQDIDQLRDLNNKADFFNRNAATRKEIRLLLSALDNDAAYRICSLLDTRNPQRPNWFRWVYFDLSLIAIMIIVGFVMPLSWILLVFVFSVNLVLHFWNKRNIFQYGAALPQLSLLLDTVNRLIEKDLPFDRKAAREYINQLSRFKKKMRWIDFGHQGLKGDFAEVLQYGYEMVKAFLLIEFRAIFSIAGELKEKKADIESLFEFVGQIDLALTIASLKESNGLTCTPQLTIAGKNLEARKIYHPLIPDCVVNDLSVNAKGILITGSNMSGKSTFLRSLAINAILAQTLYICFAECYVAPALQVHSSIRADDNLMTGDSYFMAEVAILSDLITVASSGSQCLFVLDEIFKGTNTIERVAAAKAVLSFLNRGDNIILAATHDLELVDMLQNEYDLYYFEETISDGQIFFDHKLKSGQLHGGNALRILEICRYPDSIVSEAKSIAAVLLQAKNTTFPSSKMVYEIGNKQRNQS